ncbi:hypothetical protein ACXYMX_03260 [Sporosarcina sp. CAU 1771]
MNAILSQVSMHDKMQRVDIAKRRNAEIAYGRQEKYNVDHQKKLEALEQLIKGKTDRESIQIKKSKVSELGAGQVKQVTIPVGKTLEETIDLWKNVRSEAISRPEPTTADFQLAAKATSTIMQTEAQITLHNYAHSEIDRATKVEEAESMKLASMELPSKLDFEVLEKQKRFEHAISTYSFHVQMKQQGFEIALPSFYKVA